MKTRTRIFLPFFDWYGGEGSGSHRRIIIKESQQTTCSKEGTTNNTTLLGKGRYGRVIRCKIKEECRIHQNTATGYSDNTREIDSNDDYREDFSQELAIKVRF